MFSEFLKFWKKSSLLKEATDELLVMLEKAQHMFEFSMRVMLEEEREREDIYKLDCELNLLQMDIRRKILEHLAVNPYQDINFSLILSIIVYDVERIGDYSKNTIELAHLYPEHLKGEYFDRIRRIEEKVKELFAKTIACFKNGDSGLGREIMEEHSKLAPQCERIVEDVIRDKNLTARDGVVISLLARYLKRVSAHLKNVASSVVNPFHRLTYRPEPGTSSE
jgi:phosphate uptake regulator|uniref:PhoU domain-containing protein n=1 Tax=candidate division WOR-3 bacterium TaxID=2052148 RepID=A0A7C3UQE7_UNCW3